MSKHHFHHHKFSLAWPGTLPVPAWREDGCWLLFCRIKCCIELLVTNMHEHRHSFLGTCAWDYECQGLQGQLIHTGITARLFVCLFVCLFVRLFVRSEIQVVAADSLQHFTKGSHLTLRTIVFRQKKSYLQPGYGRSPVSTSFLKLWSPVNGFIQPLHVYGDIHHCV